MERVVADALHAHFDEWRWLTIDGFIPERTEVTGLGEVAILGLCCLLPDSPLTPFSLSVRANPDGDGLARLECKVGERDPDTGQFQPLQCDSDRISKELHAIGQRAAEIEWAFEVVLAG
jgi:hypothetical protein